MIVIRVVHVVTAVFWAGAAMVMGWFITPASRRTGPAAGPFMQNLLRTRLADWAFGSAVVAVGAGLWLLFDRGGFGGGWQGVALAVGAVAGGVAITIGGFIQRPTAGKIQRLGAAIAGQTPTPEQGAEMTRLQARLAAVAPMTALAVAVAVLGMALGS
jgi:uncharacterized membrane protein